MKYITLLLGLMLILAACSTNSSDPMENSEHTDDMDVTDEADDMSTTDDTMDESGDVSMGQTVPGEDVEDMIVETTESTPDKIFQIDGENFKFLMNGEEAPELVVQEGDLVRIEFTSTGGFHDWVVDEFNAATEQVQAGDTTVVEFVADKKGTFEYYCSVGSHRANGMVGNLVVE